MNIWLLNISLLIKFRWHILIILRYTKCHAATVNNPFLLKYPFNISRFAICYVVVSYDVPLADILSSQAKVENIKESGSQEADNTKHHFWSEYFMSFTLIDLTILQFCIEKQPVW